MSRIEGVYTKAWTRLRDTVLDEKTGWGKEELKTRMDRLLIEEFEKEVEEKDK